MITGHLGLDVRMNQHQNDEYASFSVGVNRRFKTADGQQREETTWYNCTWWKPNKATDYRKKGQMVLVEGRPIAKHYKTRTGADAAVVEINVSSIELLAAFLDWLIDNPERFKPNKPSIMLADEFLKSRQ